MEKPNMFDSSEEEQIEYAFDGTLGALIMERARRVAPGPGRTVDISDLDNPLLQHFFAEGFKWGRKS